MTMDHRYLADFCKVLDNEASFRHLKLNQVLHQRLLTTDDGYGYVIMPMARDR